MQSRCVRFSKCLAILVPFAALGVAGCGGSPSSQQRLDDEVKKHNISKTDVYPLAGKVLIDGHAPAFKRKQTIVVMLNDSTKADQPLDVRRHVACAADGTFEFGTYEKGDGVSPGKYVVTFAEMMNEKKAGFVGPDQLENRYNDPEKNEKVETFVIDHKAPGKKDYSFDLKVAGVDAVKTPGAHALTDLSDKDARKKHAKK